MVKIVSAFSRSCKLFIALLVPFFYFKRVVGQCPDGYVNVGFCASTVCASNNSPYHYCTSPQPNGYCCVAVFTTSTTTPSTTSTSTSTSTSPSPSTSTSTSTSTTTATSSSTTSTSTSTTTSPAPQCAENYVNLGSNLCNNGACFTNLPTSYCTGTIGSQSNYCCYLMPTTTTSTSTTSSTTLSTPTTSSTTTTTTTPPGICPQNFQFVGYCPQVRCPSANQLCIGGVCCEFSADCAYKNSCPTNWIAAGYCAGQQGQCSTSNNMFCTTSGVCCILQVQQTNISQVQCSNGYFPAGSCSSGTSCNSNINMYCTPSGTCCVPSIEVLPQPQTQPRMQVPIQLFPPFVQRQIPQQPIFQPVQQPQNQNPPQIFVVQEPAPRQTQPDVIIVQQPQQQPQQLPQQQPQQLPQQQQQPSPIQQPQYYPILPGVGQQVQQQIIPGFTGGVLQGSQIGNGPMRPDNNPQIVQQQVPTQQLTGVNGILGNGGGISGILGAGSCTGTDLDPNCAQYAPRGCSYGAVLDVCQRTCGCLG